MTSTLLKCTTSVVDKFVQEQDLMMEMAVNKFMAEQNLEVLIKMEEFMLEQDLTEIKKEGMAN